jgi:hypothetical protein
MPLSRKGKLPFADLATSDVSAAGLPGPVNGFTLGYVPIRGMTDFT